MRKARLILLVSIAGVLALIAGTYWSESERLRNTERPQAERLPDGLNATAEDWEWSQSAGAGPAVEVRARNFRQNQSPEILELEGVELKLFHAAGEIYDRIRSAHAVFDLNARTLYSDGEVTITLAVPKDAPEPASPVSITSSKVHFDSASGKAWTDLPARFLLPGGEGTSTGAAYDPTTGELRLARDADLLWHGNKKGPPMHIQARGLLYKERESKVYLEEWAKLERNGTEIESKSAVITLEDGSISLIDAVEAQGRHKQPERTVTYAARELRAEFNDSGVITKIEGKGKAQVKSEAPAGVTEVEAGRVLLEFLDTEGQSTLQRSFAFDGAQLSNGPRIADASKGGQKQELTSDTVEIQMRGSGQELDKILTHAPGTLRLIPAGQPGPRRTLTGDRFWIHYGLRNQIESFRATAAQTVTEYPKPKGKNPAPPPSTTRSQDLMAKFDAEGDLHSLEQWGNFQYAEGDRRAQSEKGFLDQETGRIRLEGSARAWDSAGVISAKIIELHQESGDTVATGDVETTQQPKPAKAKLEKGAPAAPPSEDGGLLSQDQPLHARASKMITTKRRSHIRFEENAVLWQGPNRVQGDVVEIDRAAGSLTASGHVRTLLEERAKAPESKGKGAKTEPPKKPQLLLISAKNLHYDDKSRKALYEEEVVMKRAELTVRADTLVATFVSGEEANRLEKAEAKENVRIVIEEPGRLRSGKSQFADYFAPDEKIVLYGEGAEFTDHQKGSTRGRQLTWLAREERLEVEGQEQKPAVTKVIRR